MKLSALVLSGMMHCQFLEQTDEVDGVAHQEHDMAVRLQTGLDSTVVGEFLVV
jgi:hypothetical protein